MDYEPDLLTLTDDAGEETAYEILDVIDWGGEDYAVLFPMQEGAEGAVILRIIPTEEDEAEMFEGVEEETMQAVFAEFRRRHKDELGE